MVVEILTPSVSPPNSKRRNLGERKLRQILKSRIWGRGSCGKFYKTEFGGENLCSPPFSFFENWETQRGSKDAVLIMKFDKKNKK
jgi:hypothetical protein